MKKHEIKEKLDKGYIQFRAVMELLGKPKEHINDTANLIVKSIANNQEYSLIESNIDEIKESDGLFYTTIEVEVLVKDSAYMFGFCIDFMPASIEIIEPENLHVSHNVFTGLLNDLLGKLHVISDKLRLVEPLTNENNHLKMKVKILIENLIILTMKNGPTKIEEIASNIGILPKDLGGYLEDLEKKGIIEKGEDDNYNMVGKLKKLVVRKGKNDKTKKDSE